MKRLFFLSLFFIFLSHIALGREMANALAEETEAYDLLLDFEQQKITIQIFIISLGGAMLIILYHLHRIHQQKSAYCLQLEKENLQRYGNHLHFYPDEPSQKNINDENHHQTIPHEDHLYAVNVMEDRVFIRNQGKLIKIPLDDIWYVEAERNYSVIVTEEKSYTVVSSLKSFLEKIKNQRFLRVHRSYLVNITKLDAIAENHLEIKSKAIPLSHMYREELFKLLIKI